MKSHICGLCLCFLVIVSLKGTQCANNKTNSLVINSNRAGRKEYPFYVVISYNGMLTCGGTVVSQNYVLTAASCVEYDLLQRGGTFAVTAGKYYMDREQDMEQHSGVTEILLYNHRYDIALLRLSSTLHYTDYVQPVTFENKTGLMQLKNCYEVGFGLECKESQNPANTLQEIQTSVITRKKCRKLNKRLRDGSDSEINGKMICSQDLNSGVCTSDTGGPLVCMDGRVARQAGVLSFGSVRCVDGFNVFVLVSRFSDWLESIIQ